MMDSVPLHLSILFSCLIVAMHAPLLAQQAPQPPQPPQPDEIMLKGQKERATRRRVVGGTPDRPMHGVEPFEEDGIKVYHYPMIGQAGEIAVASPVLF